jgi:hypothetical protein
MARDAVASASSTANVTLQCGGARLPFAHLRVAGGEVVAVAGQRPHRVLVTIRAEAAHLPAEHRSVEVSRLSGSGVLSSLKF